MKKEVKQDLTPTLLRIILIVALVLIAAAHIGITYLGINKLKSDSQSVTEAITSLAVSKAELEQLVKAENILKTKTEYIKASNDLIATVKDRLYQNNIIYDAVAYGNKSGVGITGFNFNDAAISTPSASAPSATGGATAKANKVPNITSKSIVVNLRSPSDYRALLRFLKYLEGNLTQIHLQDLTLTAPDKDQSRNAVQVATLNIEVYTR